LKKRDGKDVYEWFLKIVSADEGKIEALSDEGYDNWLLSLFSLAGVDKIDLIMRKEKGVEVIHRAISSAYHEAGHAVFVWRWRDHYFDHFGITLNPQNQVGLCTQNWMRDKESKTIEDLSLYSQADINFLLAGVAAENRLFSFYSMKPSKIKNYWADYDWAIWLAKLIYGIQESEAEDILRKTYRNVSKVLRHPKTWAAVEAIAEALLIYNYLDNKTAYEIISRINPPRPSRRK